MDALPLCSRRKRVRETLLVRYISRYRSSKSVSLTLTGGPKTILLRSRDEEPTDIGDPIEMKRQLCVS